MMLPLVVSTYPENQATEVNLDEIIRITFSESLDSDTVTNENIKIKNYNTNTDITDVDISLSDNDTAIVITVPKNATGNRRFEGLCEYKVLISGIKSSSQDEIPGTFELEFTTKASDIVNIIEPPDEVKHFEVIRTHPKSNSIATSDTIKIQCNLDIDQESDLSEIKVVDAANIESIEDALFIGENIITQDVVNINGNIIEITLPELDSGKKYLAIIKNIIDNINKTEIIPYMYPFYAPFSTMYSSVYDIESEVFIRNITSKMNQFDIALRIYNNSIFAEFIAREAKNTEVDFVTPALYVSEYVKTKTQYDIIFDKFIDITSGATSKQLKDLQIDYGYNPNQLLKMADRLKLRYQYWEDFLKGKKNRGNAKAATFNKGSEIDENPDFMDRKLKDMEGSKTW